MMFVCYMIPLAAWAVFIYNMHHSGGRPTTAVWWAFMTGLGTFELGKGVAGTVDINPPVLGAVVVGVLAAGAVLVVHARRTWNVGVEASPATGR